MGIIVTPLARCGLVAAWLVGYIFSLRDTGITMPVYPPGYEMLPVRIFTLVTSTLVRPSLRAFRLCRLMHAPHPYRYRHPQPATGLPPHCRPHCRPHPLAMMP